MNHNARPVDTPPRVYPLAPGLRTDSPNSPFSSSAGSIGSKTIRSQPRLASRVSLGSRPLSARVYLAFSENDLRLAVLFVNNFCFLGIGIGVVDMEQRIGKWTRRSEPG